MNARLQKGAREAPSAQELHVSLQTPSAMQRVEPAWCLLHFLSEGHGERGANTNWAPAGLDSRVFLGKVLLAAVKAVLWGSGTRQLCWALPQGRNSGMVMLSLTQLRLLTQCLGHLGELAKHLLVLSNHVPMSMVHCMRANTCYFCRIDSLQAHKFHQGFLWLIDALLPLLPSAVAVWCQITVMWDLGFLSVSVAKSELLASWQLICYLNFLKILF